jgi:glycine cleavage system aminomethyltransferase T
VTDGGYRAIDSLSAEKGYRHWHQDLTPADTPLEAGLAFTVLAKLKRLAAGEASCDFLGGAALVEQVCGGGRDGGRGQWAGRGRARSHCRLPPPTANR